MGPALRNANRSRNSRSDREFLLFVPGRFGFFPGYRVKDLSIPRLHEFFEGLPAHCGINMQTGNAYDGAEFFKKKEDHTIVNEFLPCPASYHVAFLDGKVRCLECGFRVG